MNEEQLRQKVLELELQIKKDLETLQQVKKELGDLKSISNVSATGFALGKGIYGKSYYFIDDQNAVRQTVSTDAQEAEKRINVANYFFSVTEACKEGLRRAGQDFIKMYATKHNSSLDWRKVFGKRQYYINMNRDKGLVCYVNVETAKGLPYFDNKEDAENCIKELKEKYTKEVLNIIFGVAVKNN